MLYQFSYYDETVTIKRPMYLITLSLIFGRRTYNVRFVTPPIIISIWITISAAKNYTHGSLEGQRY